MAILITTPVFSQELSDSEITSTIEREFRMSPFDANKVDVKTNDGIAMLNGSTDNILAREKLVKITKSVRGVEGVIDRIDVNAPLIADRILKDDLNDALLQDPATENFEIDLIVNAGNITLNGNVDSWQEKFMAEDVVKSIRGVKSVENNLKFQFSTSRPDIEIENEVRKAISADIMIDDGKLDVKVDDAEVTLEGVVGSAIEKDRALKHAWVANVKSVDVEELKVSDYFRERSLIGEKYKAAPDSEIEANINHALLYDPRVESHKVDVDVINGVAYLRGNVNDYRTKKASAENTRNIVGVKSVENYLKVRPLETPTDPEIRKKVKTKLKKDPFVERFDILVSSYNGTVYLNGMVDNNYEKIRAAEVAENVSGVVDIENNIRLDIDLGSSLINKYYDNENYDFYGVEQRYSGLDDYTIQRNIGEEFWWSPFVDKNEVEVDVENGKAVLNGEVDTYNEKRYAVINAYEGGAEAVEDNLEVVDNQ